MLKAISQNYTGLRGFQQMLDVTANNIANVNTVAYKEKQVSFHELTYRLLAERRLPHAGDPPLPPHNTGRGTAVNSIVPSREQGALKLTERQLDLALVGEGYFRVIRPDGSFAYTRSGNFSLDGEGNLTMPGGILLDPPLFLRDYENRIDFDSLTISPNGVIRADRLPPADGEDFFEDDEMSYKVELGQILLYDFLNPQSLMEVGDNLYLPSEATAPPREGVPGEDGLGEVRQGYLENANVDLARQFTSIIRGQRAMQSSSRAMHVADELWALTLNLQA